MKKSNITNYIAIFMLFFFANAGTFMNSAVQTCIDAWPDVSVELIRMLTTLPPVFTTITLLVTGNVVGKNISYRQIAMIGSVFIAVGGLIPAYYAPNWTFVLIFRCILGIGAGCFGMRNALLLKSVPSEKQTSFTGYGGVLFSLSLVIMAPLVGNLAGYGWQYAFLGNVLIIPIGLWLFLFLREPVGQSEVENNETAENDSNVLQKNKGNLAWIYVFLMFCSSFAIYAFHIGISTYIETKGLGTASAAGTVISAYMVGGILVSLLLSQLRALLGRYLLPLSFVSIAVGHAIILFLPSMVMIYIGAFLSGCGYMIMYSVLQVYNAQVTPAGKVAFFSMIILIGAQLGMFITPYYISGMDAILKMPTDIESAFLSCVIIHIVLAIIAFIPKISPDAGGKRA